VITEPSAVAPGRSHGLLTRSLTRRYRARFFKNGSAPRGALLAALWGDEPLAGKLQLYLFSEAVRTFTGILLEVTCLTSRSCLPRVLGAEEYSLPHTVFSSQISLGSRLGTVNIQLDRT
jgi:hypothetical protein